MGAWAQLRLLLWKNWLQQIRSPWFTLMEFLIPMLLIATSFGLMIGLRGNFENDHQLENYPEWPVMGSAWDFVMPTNTSNPSSAILDPMSLIANSTYNCPFFNLTWLKDGGVRLDAELIFSPITAITKTIMDLVKDRYTTTIGNPLFVMEPTNKIPLPKYLEVNMVVKGFETEDEMVAYAKESFSNECGNSLLAGITFNDSIAKRMRSESNLSYTIRLSNTNRQSKGVNGRHNFRPWNTREFFAIQFVSGPINPLESDGGYPGYWKEGFMTIQKAINNAIYENLTGRRIELINTDLMVNHFSRTAATLIAVVGWMLLYFWYAIFNSFDVARPFSLSAQLVNSLNPDIAMAYGITLLAQYETQAHGLHWDQLFTPPTPDQRLTVGHCFIMLLIDGIYLMIITWYIEAVYPGGEGVPQKPWFFLLVS
ncbi:unnamed protein product [Angiostrongylus costaricensis]|uniref:ATP-binding cassette sub-family A member 3 n=1 Tax=Angiostrongylus costaricensis TaxID=334426 RepID=A0A0R3Q1G6_ANGCS|nr:unnamed protein product [Angiostrongylus costaricensis]